MNKQILAGIILLTIISISSCSSIPSNMRIEPIQELHGNTDANSIDNQIYLIKFLENIINSEEKFTVEIFGRRTFSPFLIQTKLLTHSFYVINLNNEKYYTLSFSGSNFKPYSDGFWVLNKEVDISSYRLFKEGINIWDVRNILAENNIDAFLTLENVISAVKNGANYYFLDHYISKPNSFNCNSAIKETIALKF